MVASSRPATQNNEGQAEALASGCRRVSEPSVEGGERMGSQSFRTLAQGENEVGTALADGFLKFRGAEPSVDGAAVQAHGGRRRSDCYAPGQREGDLSLARGERQ